MTRSHSRRRIRPGTYLFFFILFSLIVFLSHATLLRLPYYGDEIGTFVPAALDLYHHRAVLTHGVAPGVPAYLASSWMLAGYSVMHTRLAMLLLASLAVLVVFLLAIELCRSVGGSPAFMAVFLLCASPLFFAQAMLAQLDMPALLFTSLALLLFLQDKIRPAALACCALVLVKETGVIVPLLFAAWLLFEKRRDAAWFLLPATLLAAWLLVAGRFSLHYPFHPVRIVFAFARRLYDLLFQDFHWIGAIAILFAIRRGVFSSRAWRVAAWVAAAHVLLFSFANANILERDLLPILPIFYTATLAALSVFPGVVKVAGQVALLAGLIAGNFWNPPYPFPLENNLAFTDFVELQRTAAGFVESSYPGRCVATAWPLTDALRNPELGYVHHPVPVCNQSNAQVVISFSRMWEPEWSWAHFDFGRKIWTHFYGYQPDRPPTGVENMTPVARWVRHGLWIEVFEVTTARPVLAFSAFDHRM